MIETYDKKRAEACWRLSSVCQREIVGIKYFLAGYDNVQF